MYEPYCANYTMASEIMLQEEHNLTVSLVPWLFCWMGSRLLGCVLALTGYGFRRLIISSM